MPPSRAPRKPGRTNVPVNKPSKGIQVGGIKLPWWGWAIVIFLGLGVISAIVNPQPRTTTDSQGQSAARPTAAATPTLLPASAISEACYDPKVFVANFNKSANNGKDTCIEDTVTTATIGTYKTSLKLSQSKDLAVVVRDTNLIGRDALKALEGKKIRVAGIFDYNTFSSSTIKIEEANQIEVVNDQGEGVPLPSPTPNPTATALATSTPRVTATATAVPVGGGLGSGAGVGTSNAATNTATTINYLDLPEAPNVNVNTKRINPCRYIKKC